MHYDTGLYSADCEEKIAIDEAVFWSTSKMNLQESRNLLSKKSTPILGSRLLDSSYGFN